MKLPLSWKCPIVTSSHNPHRYTTITWNVGMFRPSPTSWSHHNLMITKHLMAMMKCSINSGECAMTINLGLATSTSRYLDLEIVLNHQPWFHLLCVLACWYNRENSNGAVGRTCEISRLGRKRQEILRRLMIFGTSQNVFLICFLGKCMPHKKTVYTHGTFIKCTDAKLGKLPYALY